MPFNKKGQGSLEYLLIIGGGILVAVVIIGAIVSLAGSGTGGAKATIAEQSCNTYQEIAQCQSADITGVTADSSPLCPTGGTVTYSVGVSGRGECCFYTAGTPAVNKKCVLAANVTFT